MSWKVVPLRRTHNSKLSVSVAAVGLSDDIIMSLSWLQSREFCSESSILRTIFAVYRQAIANSYLTVLRCIWHLRV